VVLVEWVDSDSIVRFQMVLSQLTWLGMIFLLIRCSCAAAAPQGFYIFVSKVEMQGRESLRRY
jgi:hypothetical protein